MHFIFLGHQRAIRESSETPESSESHQSHQSVIRESSESHHRVIRESSESHCAVVETERLFSFVIIEVFTNFPLHISNFVLSLLQE